MAISVLLLMVTSTLISSALGISGLLDPAPTGVTPVSYCDRDYSCHNCSAVRVCAPTSDGSKLYELRVFSCNSNNPYCNYATGTCGSDIDPVCYNNPNTTISKNFTCMRDGYFPDPTNCSLYYYCQDEVAYQYSCYNPTPYYHPGYQYCVSSRYYCTDYTSSYYCGYSSYQGRKVAIAYTSNYFLFCGVNSDVVTVDRCIGYYQFSSSSQTCSFACSGPGLFLKDDDCANYFKCSPLREGGYLMTNMTCPPGQAFLESEFSCVDRSLVPNCAKVYPDLYSK